MFRTHLRNLSPDEVEHRTVQLSSLRIIISFDRTPSWGSNTTRCRYKFQQLDVKRKNIECCVNWGMMHICVCVQRVAPDPSVSGNADDTSTSLFQFGFVYRLLPPATPFYDYTQECCIRTKYCLTLMVISYPFCLFSSVFGVDCETDSTTHMSMECCIHRC